MLNFRWASDTWHLFAPVFAIPVAVVYCTLNLIPAVLLGAVFRFIFKRTVMADRLEPDEPAAE